MVQKSGDHQLRLVVYPIVYKILYIPGGYLQKKPNLTSLRFPHPSLGSPGNRRFSVALRRLPAADHPIFRR